MEILQLFFARKIYYTSDDIFPESYIKINGREALGKDDNFYVYFSVTNILMYYSYKRSYQIQMLIIVMLNHQFL